QFHCGKAPPAAEPSTMAVRCPICGGISALRESELGGQIAVDLESDANFDEGRSCPGHGVSLSTAVVDRRFSPNLSAGPYRRKGVVNKAGPSGISAGPGVVVL